jgi:hypothetical protein
LEKIEPPIDDATLETARGTRPEIDFLILAERAEVLNGKLYLMGGVIDRLWSMADPPVVNFCVALGILIPWNATNEPMDVHVSIQTEEGEELAHLNWQMTVGRPPLLRRGDVQRGAIASPPLALQMPGVGLYVAVATVNEQQKRVPFRVVPPGQ